MEPPPPIVRSPKKPSLNRVLKCCGRTKSCKRTSLKATVLAGYYDPYSTTHETYTHRQNKGK